MNNEVKERALLKIAVSELSFGMYVSKLDRPWEETPFLFQGFPVKTHNQIQRLAQYCEYVYVDVYKDLMDSAKLVLESLPKEPVEHPEPTHSVEQEMPRAKRQYEGTLKDVKSLITAVREDKPVKLDSVAGNVSACIDSIERNPSAMLWLSRIRDVNQYTAEHALNVSLLAIGFGRFLGLTREQLEVLGFCGVVHDLGKIGVPVAVLNKEGELSAGEFDQVKEHPLIAVRLLAKHSDVPTEAKLAALQHHERVDGTGYPSQMKANEISLYAKIIAIIDAYDAITTDRCYRASKSPSFALSEIYRERNGYFDEQLVHKFVEFIGIYPPGSLVEMKTGEVAIVVSNTHNTRLQPKVLLLLDMFGEPLAPRFVDLSKPNASYKLMGAVEDSRHNLDLREITEQISGMSK